jgi:hypothetical protein
MPGFEAFESARKTIAGVEVMRWVPEGYAGLCSFLMKCLDVNIN